MRILVVEDNPSLGSSLKKSLETYHYAVDLVVNGEDAVVLGLSVPYDLIILDILLPGLDGFEVCRKLRHRRRTVPILILTALDSIDQRVNGLNLGADDYLVKPFAFRELEARVRALLLRESASKTSLLSFLDVTLDTTTHEVRRGQRSIMLSSMLSHTTGSCRRRGQHLW